jgi:hypothetical protein
MVLGLFFFARLRNFIEQHDKIKCGTVTVPHFFCAEWVQFVVYIEGEGAMER